MKVQEIHRQLRNYKSSGKSIFITSSFQTHSIPLLHIISSSGVNVDVVFIETGFHFPETLVFRDEVAKQLGLKILEARSAVPKIQQMDSEGLFYFVSDPDHCCALNKTWPVEPFLMRYDVWISGVRGDQNANRRNMKVEQEAPFNTLRFHPMLDWSAKQIHAYRMEHGLPEHPLDGDGYQSIGCAPCTQKVDLTDPRSARWFGMNKTECGLHKDLIKQP